MANELKALKLKRSPARGWLKRSKNSLDVILQDADCDRVAVEDGLSELNKRLAALTEIQEELELYLTEEELAADMVEAGNIYDESVKLRVTATRKLRTLIKEDDDNSSSSSSGPSGNKIAKLPKIELPKFKGDASKFREFWDQFSATIDASDLPVITKFTYLKSLVKDEAKATIDGLSLTQEHYKVACDILQERYGRKELIVFAHIQNLLSLKADDKTKDSHSQLRSLMDQINIQVRSLEALGIDGSTYGVVLTPVILSRLPGDVRMEWSREGKGKEGDLSWLLEFLKGELERRERADTFKVSRPDEAKKEEKKQSFKKPSVGTAAAFHSAEGSAKKCCIFCDKTNHTANKCWFAKKMTREDKQKCFMKAGLCFKCSESGHRARSCSGKCDMCGKGHHRLLCENSSTSNKEENVAEKSKVEPDGTVDTQNLSCVAKTVSHSVVLQTARVMIEGPYSRREANVLFDSGSDRTYVSEELVKSLKLKPISSVNHRYNVFGGGKSRVSVKSVVEIKMISNKGEYKVEAVAVPTICSPLQRPLIPVELLKSCKVPILNDTRNEPMKIDLLVGLDNYWQLVGTNATKIADGKLVIQETVFGNMLSGLIHGAKGESSSQLLVLNDVSENEVRRFWEVEHIGILPDEKSHQSTIQKQFNETIEYRDGRYSVSLPWKPEGKDNLQSNEASARERLNKLMYRLDKDPNLKEEYSKIFEEWMTAGIIEEVPAEEEETDNPTYYLPHHPVIRQQRTSTKIRPVFDGSAKARNGLSLNDCLETGPNLLPDLVEILIRFRRHIVAIIADVIKAFLQICLKDEDRDAHRFMIYLDGKIRKMRFCRVAFGINCSPFLLNATVKYHLNQQPVSRTVEELKENLYMDDWLSGADEISEAADMHDDADTIMLKAGMQLSKWNTNQKEILDKESPIAQEIVKVLGVKWNSDEDVFQFEGVQVPTDVVVTKRVILSVLARTFDPLGLISPVLMTGKILFQQMWKLGLDWDDEVPPELTEEFKNWVDSLEILKTWLIPRKFCSNKWSEIDIELHAYGDASELGYGAVVYLVSSSDKGKESSLVMSKAKVTPLKRITLPRLELLSCLLAARLMSFVRNALHMPKVKYKCWTDSQVALCWIQSSSYDFKQFVANRVQEIQNLTDPKCWAHVPGCDNPADLMTRGLHARMLMESNFWLHGPDVLTEEKAAECVKFETPDDVETKEMIESEIVMSNVSHEIESQKLYETERCSSFRKAVRIMELVMKFVKLMKSKLGKSQQCPVDDLHENHTSFDSETNVPVKLLLLQDQKNSFPDELKILQEGKQLSKKSKLHRLNPFLDESGIIRIKGRIQNAELSFAEKHPIILGKTWLSKLILRDAHINMKHAGVDMMITEIRKQYWIISIRKIAKSVVRECLNCQRLMAKKCNQEGAPLPKERITQNDPFSITGVDYAGPLYVIDMPGEKLYICLFTCSTIRAVHLELTMSLTSNEFLHAFRRFQARRGLPKLMISDNAKTFKGVQAPLKSMFGSDAPQWKFIVPRAPWWGGWWERMVGVVKSSLKKCLGNSLVTKEELITLLIEIESVVNSRPLTQVTDNIDDQQPISPNDFLLNKSHQSAVLGLQPVDDPDNIVKIYRGKQKQLQKFWKIWSSKYLQNLPKMVPQFQERSTLKKGDIVLVQDDSLSRVQWPMGRIVDTFVGQDGKIRSVLVKTAKGQLTRPIQKLCHLEAINPTKMNMDEDLQNEEMDEQTVQKPSEEVKVQEKITSKTDDTQKKHTARTEVSRRKVPVSKTDDPHSKVDKSGETEVKTNRRGRVIRPRDVLDL